MILRPRKARGGTNLNSTKKYWEPHMFRSIDEGTEEWINAFQQERGEPITLEEFKKNKNLHFPNKMKEEIFDIIPTGFYAVAPTLLHYGINAVIDKKRERIGPLVHNELWAKDLGATGDYDYIEPSPVKPEYGNQNTTYYRPKNYDKEVYLNKILTEFEEKAKQKPEDKKWEPIAKSNKKANIAEHDVMAPIKKWLFGDNVDEPLVTRNEHGDLKMLSRTAFPFNYKGRVVEEDPLGTYTVYNHDQDPNGRYISFYDKWNFKNGWLTNLFIDPVESYDRIYYEENPERKNNEYQARKSEEEYDKWAKEANKKINQLDSLTTNKLPITNEFLRGYDAVQDSLRKYNEGKDWAKERARNTFKYRVRNDITSTPSRGLIRNRDEERERYRIP